MDTMFEGEKVRLRSWELSDLDDLMKDWNNLKLRQYLHSPLPYSREEEEQWIRRSWEERQRGIAYNFAIENKETKELLGSGGLFGINRISNSTELGISINAERNWGKGYGTDAMRVLLKIGFDYLNMHRIQLRVIEFNERAIKTYKNVGLTEVGRFRKSQFWEGKYYDHIMMDILREEWIQIKKNEK
ncbi:MAG: N-acetyltransferase [Candidatus Heimdallarchaeota archaeon]|nr:N-acetyltransferase [Candidatus Heimdallarchaeota archaeon]